MHTTAPQPLIISAALNKTPYWHSGQRDCDYNRASELRRCHVLWQNLPEPWGGTADTLTGTWKAERAAHEFSLRVELARAAWDGQKAAHESSEGHPLSWQQCPTAPCRARQGKHFELLQSAFSGQHFSPWDDTALLSFTSEMSRSKF